MPFVLLTATILEHAATVDFKLVYIIHMSLFIILPITRKTLHMKQHPKTEQKKTLNKI